MSDLLLLSGGIDSTALAAWMRPSLCLTVDYGQKAAKAEIQSAQKICSLLELKHQIVKCDLRTLGSGDMAGKPTSQHSSNSEFWPFRNQFLVTLGAMAAVSSGLERVILGTVNSDKRHVDGTFQFRNVLSKVLAIQEGQIELLAPAAELSSYELVSHSRITVDILAWAHSCHVSDLACGSCNGCIKHSHVMEQLGLKR